MKAYITKYALTSGIQEMEGEVNSDISDRMFSTNKGTGYYGESFFGEGKDWHRTKEGAISRAEQMRIAKIASLEKSIVKMNKLVFK